ncbi:uncharacterized protein [Nicotiana sylvestris]|uniref:uncharacterized protein n=1 Tax=Nicotiana sylvestris TaxID=4096 RepID=UPI00388CE789
MLRKDVETSWTEDYQRAFDKIKEYLSTPPVLVPPEPGKPLLLYLSVLDRAFGCVLRQHDDTGRKDQAIYYLNHLAENPVRGEYEPLKTYFPEEEVSFVGEDIAEAYDGWRMFFDGAANFKGVGIGAVLVSERGQNYPVQGEWATKNTKILPYLYHVQELMKRFTKTEFKHVPRVQNEFADTLATLSSMIQHPDKNFNDPILVRIHSQPAYCAHVDEETDGNPWFHDIKEYLAKGEYHDQANQTQKCTHEPKHKNSV